MNIVKIMTPKCNTITLMESSSVREGMEIMSTHGFTAIPVLNAQGQYLGSVTEGDFLRHIMNVGTLDMEIHERFPVGAIFRPDFCPPLRIDAKREDVLETALKQNFVPIVDDRNTLCGIVTRRSLIAYLAQLVPPED